MPIERRRLEPIAPFKPPKEVATSEAISRDHSQKLFKTGTDLIKDAVGLLDKHVDANKKALVNQLSPKLKSLLSSYSAQERVANGITQTSLLKDALSDDGEMARFRELTGVTASKGDLKFVLDSIKRSDAATPIQNYLAFSAELMKEHGGARIEKGQLVQTDLPSLFKEATGKDIYKYLPKKHVQVAMESHFRKDSVKMLADATVSGSLDYNQAMAEAGRVLGKGSEHYERARKEIFNANYERRTKLANLQRISEEGRQERLSRGPFELGEGLPEDAKPGDKRRFVENATARAYNQIMYNTDPTISLDGMLNGLDYEISEGPNMEPGTTFAVIQGVRARVLRDVSPGLDHFVPFTEEVAAGSVASSRRQGPRTRRLTEAERQQKKDLFLNRYMELRARGFAYLKDSKGGSIFSEYSESEKGVVMKEALNRVRLGLKTHLPQTGIDENSTMAQIYAASLKYKFSLDDVYGYGFRTQTNPNEVFLKEFRERQVEEAIKKGEMPGPSPLDATTFNYLIEGIHADISDGVWA